MAVTNKDGVRIEPRSLALNPELELSWDQFLLARAEFRASLTSKAGAGHKRWRIWMSLEGGESSPRLDLASTGRMFQWWGQIRPVTNEAGEILVASGPLRYLWRQGNLVSCTLGFDGVLPELSSKSVTLSGYDDQSEALNEFWRGVQRSIGHALVREVGHHD